MSLLKYPQTLSYAEALKIVIVLHVTMFVVSLGAAVFSRSSSVFADSLDFIGDAISYSVSLLLIGRSIILQSITAIIKAFSMIIFGIPVLAYSVTQFVSGVLPSYEVMSITAAFGILTHLVCIWILLPHNSGDSNRLSVWVCTLNDLLCNLLTLIASGLILITGKLWPDLMAAMIIVIIAFIGAFIVLRQAISELSAAK